jgi:protoporphyrinogen oxidase
MDKKIVIIGAGPTGLGAGYKLNELGYRNWKIFEKNSYVGGLSASFRDEYGFTWDVGGHVLFSKNEYFNTIIKKVLGDECLEHKRESWIRIMDIWVPYPFQNNLRYLPKEIMIECLMGLIKARTNSIKSSNFHEWIIANFGQGVYKYFMGPVNKKTWSFPLDKMNKDWIAERISVNSLEGIIKNIVYNQDDVNWGPNNTFKFPLRGGTGGLFNRFVPYIKDRLHLNYKLVSIDIKNRTITFENGKKECYDILINSSPLKEFIQMIENPIAPSIRKSAHELRFNSELIVGIGLNRANNIRKCWMYFPEDKFPFYRVTYLSNYSPYNVPVINNYFSLMCEITYSEFKAVDKKNIIEDTIDGLIAAELIMESDRELIVSKYIMDVDRAYPIPSLGRNEALRKITPFLEKNQIFSRGRFGAWLYEIGNMDHSFMMGVEVVNRLLRNEKEQVFFT